MARKAARPCSYPGCPALVHEAGKTYCPAHQKQTQGAYNRRRGSSASRGYDATWRETRAAYLHVHPTCATAGCGRPAVHVDHITPKDKGGADAWTNLQGLCPSCHSRKTAQEHGGWHNK
jgi:5-methylcytosine-specific restriction protein A